MAAQVFTVSPVLGPVEAERCQAGPRHPPRLHHVERLLRLDEPESIGFFASHRSFDLNQWRGRLRVSNVQTAFRLLEPGPAPGTDIFSGLNCASAVRATNAGIIAVVQRVVGNI